MYNRPCRIPAFGSVRKNNGIFCGDLKSFPRPLRYPEKCRTGCPDWIFGVYCPAESRCFFASFLYLFSPSRKASLHSRRRVSAGEAAGTKFSCFFVCPFPCPFPPERQFFPLRRRASAGKCNGYQIQLFFRVPFSLPFSSGKAVLSLTPPGIRGEMQWVPNPTQRSTVLFHSRTSAPSTGRTLFPRSVRLTTPLPRAEPAPGSFAAARENWQLPSRQALGEVLSSSRALPKGFSPGIFRRPSRPHRIAPHPGRGPPFPARAAEHPSHPVPHKMRRRRHPPPQMSDPASRTGFPPDRLGCGPVAGYRRKLLQPGAGFRQGAGALCEIVAVHNFHDMRKVSVPAAKPETCVSILRTTSLKRPRMGQPNCIADSWRPLKGLFFMPCILVTRKRVRKRLQMRLIRSRGFFAFLHALAWPGPYP